MKLKIPLRHKPSDFVLNDCLIDKVITLPQRQFDDLLTRPLADRACIAENVPVMFEDRGNYHCMLILGDDCPDGVVVEAEGYSYARYAAYLPGAKTLVDSEVRLTAEYIIHEGVNKTADGNWAISYEDLEQMCGLKVTEDNGFGPMVLEALWDREEVDVAELTAGGIDTSYYLDYCLHLEDAPDNRDNDDRPPTQGASSDGPGMCGPQM